MHTHIHTCIHNITHTYLQNNQFIQNWIDLKNTDSAVVDRDMHSLTQMCMLHCCMHVCIEILSWCMHMKRLDWILMHHGTMQLIKLLHVRLVNDSIVGDCQQSWWKVVNASDSFISVRFISMQAECPMQSVREFELVWNGWLFLFGRCWAHISIKCQDVIRDKSRGVSMRVRRGSWKMGRDESKDTQQCSLHCLHSFTVDALLVN